MWDFNKILSYLEVTKVSEYTLFLLQYGTSKIINEKNVKMCCMPKYLW